MKLFSILRPDMRSDGVAVSNWLPYWVAKDVAVGRFYFRNPGVRTPAFAYWKVGCSPEMDGKVKSVGESDPNYGRATEIATAEEPAERVSLDILLCLSKEVRRGPPVAQSKNAFDCSDNFLLHPSSCWLIV